MKREAKKNWLPAAAALVVLAAALSVLLPKLTAKENEGPILSGDRGSVLTDGASGGEASPLSGDGQSVAIETAGLSDSASFFDYDAGGITVELFAVKASDGSVRLALNTCQVCNGSPYAYFVQDGDDFVCQNCLNRFASSQVGLAAGGCNPVPITEADYIQEDGSILVPLSFLEENAYRFETWKKF